MQDGSPLDPQKTTNELILVLLSFLYLFSPGSVFVNYVVRTGAASFTQVGDSNRAVPQFLDTSYQLNPSTFTRVITSKLKFSVFSFNLYFSILSLNHVAALCCWWFCTGLSRIIYFLAVSFHPVSPKLSTFMRGPCMQYLPWKTKAFQLLHWSVIGWTWWSQGSVFSSLNNSKWSLMWSVQRREIEHL